MSESGKSKKSWKDRVLDTWHQPWYARSASYNDSHRNQDKPTKTARHSKRRPLSTATSSVMQSSCAFLQQLPGEIRNAIYRQLLGDRRLSILGSFTSSAKNGITHREILQADNGYFVMARHVPTSKLAILQTCRQIYTEAVAILYATNCFHLYGLPHLPEFNRFTQIIPHTRLSCITKLSVSCQVDYFEPRHFLAAHMFRMWKRMWKTVTLEMLGLRRVSLHLGTLWGVTGFKLNAETYWVKPFLQLQNLDAFELVAHEFIMKPHQQLTDGDRSEIMKDMNAKVDRLREYCQRCCARTYG
ncbi:MAG: hypothetical protein LQ352_000984 [Teloschistes flavicans]|nr:MAG: hypothetical protein LQ352_000984 [Teloschistes flavicans]